MQPYRFLVVAWFALITIFGFTKSCFSGNRGEVTLRSFFSFRFWFSLFRKEDKSFAMKKRMMQEKTELDQDLVQAQRLVHFFCQSEIFWPHSLAVRSSASVSQLYPFTWSVSSSGSSCLYTCLQHSTPRTGKCLPSLLAQALQPSFVMVIW